MAKTIKFGKEPREKDLAWFVKHVGPRTHYTRFSIGGKGWLFTYEQDNPWAVGQWFLTVQDEKMLTYWTLMK